MKLTDLFPNYYIENKEFECKGRLNRNDTLSWLKTVDGFSNCSGGTLFLGIEDKTFNLIGYDQKEADSEKLFFHNEISNHMNIAPTYIVELVPYEINNSTRFILKIKILEANKKPLMVRYNGMPMIFVRRDGFTNPATEEEIRMMILTSDHPSFDEGLTDIDFNIKDFSKLSLFYKERTGKELTMKDLESIKNNIVNGKISNGLYLFSDHNDGQKNTNV